MSNSNLFLYIGKPVKNEYGKLIGKVASFALTPSGKFEAVFVEFGDGQFSKQPMDNMKFNGADVTYISKIKNQASLLCDQIPLIWRKDQALKDLNDKRKIAPEVYQDLRSSFTNVLAQLKKDAQVIIEEAAVEIARCQEEITSLSYAIANTEIEHEIGKVDEESYKASFALLQDALKRAVSEKTDFELMKSKVSSVLLGDTQDALQKTKIYAEQVNVAAQKLPEPPVVVYVKEVGKAGI